MKLGFGPKYFLKCVLTDSVNNSISKKKKKKKKKIDFGLNGPDRVTFVFFPLYGVKLGTVGRYVLQNESNAWKYSPATHN